MASEELSGTLPDKLDVPLDALIELAIESWRLDAQGAAVLAENNQAKLEESVRRLWRLEPVEETTANNERSMRPGLKS